MHLKGLELEVATIPPPRKVSFTEYCRNAVNSSLRKNNTDTFVSLGNDLHLAAMPRWLETKQENTSLV